MEKHDTILGHLGELRIRLIKVLLWFIVFAILSYYFSNKILLILTKPLLQLSQFDMIFTGIEEGFIIHLKLAFLGGFILSMPILIIHIYGFVRPGLDQRETNIFRIVCILGPILFVIGILFVYYFVIPIAWKFFLSFDSGFKILLYAKVSEYLALVIRLMLCFGLIFEMPIIIIILVCMKIIGVQQLKTGRRFVIVGIFAISGVVTPPDILSQFLLALPMILLYELSVVICEVLCVRHQVDNSK